VTASAERPPSAGGLFLLVLVVLLPDMQSECEQCTHRDSVGIKDRVHIMVDISDDAKTFGAEVAGMVPPPMVER
jgi:hypothetical protein